MWGTVGIGYNEEKVRAVLGKDAVLDSWSMVFDLQRLALDLHALAVPRRILAKHAARRVVELVVVDLVGGQAVVEREFDRRLERGIFDGRHAWRGSCREKSIAVDSCWRCGGAAGCG